MVWKGGREAEGNGLLNRRTDECLYRGFESPPFRFHRNNHVFDPLNVNYLLLVRLAEYFFCVR